MTNIMIGTPCYSGRVTTYYADSIMMYSNQTNYNITSLYLIGDSLINRARNIIFTHFYRNMKKQELSHLLWQDDDISLDSNGLKSLISSGKDVIGEAVPLKIPTSEYGYICAVTGVYDQVNKYLYKTKYLGLGIMCLSSKAVEDIVQYCIENDFVYEYLGEEYFDVFRCGVNKNTKMHLSEDWYLCEVLSEIGYEIYVDSSGATRHSDVYRAPSEISPPYLTGDFSHGYSPKLAHKYWCPNDLDSIELNKTRLEV